MKTYIGTKIINARPMSRANYNTFRGWELPADENGNDEGYLVEYTDGGKPNTLTYKGYVSWSPKDIFERSYKELSALNTRYELRLGRWGTYFSNIADDKALTNDEVLIKLNAADKLIDGIRSGLLEITST